MVNYYFIQQRCKKIQVLIFVALFTLLKYLINYLILTFDLTPLTYTVPDETDLVTCY